MSRNSLRPRLPGDSERTNEACQNPLEKGLRSIPENCCWHRNWNLSNAFFVHCSSSGKSEEEALFLNGSAPQKLDSYIRYTLKTLILCTDNGEHLNFSG